MDLERSFLDPWSCAACIPDGSRGTGCYSVKQYFSQTTGVAGSANFFCWDVSFGGQAISYSDTATTTNTPTVTGNMSNATAISTIDSLFAKARCVSAGVRATYIGPTQTDGGVIIAGLVTGGTAVNAFNGVTAATFCQLCKSYRVFPLRNGAQVLWQPDSMMDMDNFVTFNGGAAAVTLLPTTPYIVLGVYGAAASQSTIAVEAIANFEGQYSQTSFLPGGEDDARAVPAETGWYEAIMNAARSVEAIVPAIGEFASNTSVGRALSGAALNMANGYLYPDSMGGRVPRLRALN